MPEGEASVVGTTSASRPDLCLTRWVFRCRVERAIEGVGGGTVHSEELLQQRAVKNKWRGGPGFLANSVEILKCYEGAGRKRGGQ